MNKDSIVFNKLDREFITVCEIKFGDKNNNSKTTYLDMKKKILLIIIITILQTFSSFAQIKVYEVTDCGPNAMSCGDFSTIRYADVDSNSLQLQWTSLFNLTPTSITVELNYAVNCGGTSSNNKVRLNGSLQSAQSVPVTSFCECQPSGSAVTTWTLNPSNYAPGGVNIMQIDAMLSSEGLEILPGYPGVYARVTVNYSPNPEINIKGGTTSIVNNDVTPSLVDETDYGSVSAGTSLNHTFTIENQGANPLLLTGNPLVSISGSNAFSIQTQPASATIAGSGSQTFVVKFNSTCAQAGLQTAVVSIANNDSDENPYAFTVQGTAVDNVKPTAIAKNITVQLDTAGSVTVNASQLNNGSTDNCGISNYKLALGTTGTSCNMVNEGSYLGLTAVSGVFNEVLFASYGTPTGSCGNYSLGGCNSLTSVSAVSGVLIGRSNVSILADNFTFGDPCVGTSKKLAVTARYGPAIASATSSLTFSCTDIGVKNVVLYVTDNNGNVSTVNATITIEDKAVPVITSNGNKNVNADANACGAAVSVSATATDNCSVGTPTGVRSDAKSLTALYPVGTTTITWNVTDAKGNSAVPVTQSVVVTDAQNPTIATLSAISVNADAGVCTYASSQLTAPTATDNCSVKSIVATPASLVLGANTVTWTVTDGSDLTATSIQTVTVLDTQNPTIATLSAISVDADAGVCTYASSQLTAPTTTDNCSVKSIVATPASLVLGANTVTWTVTDGSDLTATSTQTVTVLDTQNPTITCAVNQTQATDTGICSAVVAVIAPIASDNCGVKTLINDFNGTSDASGTYPVGTTEVIWTATDESGNVSICTQQITVEDTELPVVLTKNFTAQLNESGIVTIQVADIDDNSSDNCGIVKRELDITSFTCANIGSNTVKLTITDKNGNFDSKDVIVVVEDAIKPTIITKNTTIQLDAAGNATIQVSDVDDNSFDNCEIATRELDKTSFTCDNVGPNTVKLTIKDKSGNFDSKEVIVTVEDNIKPIVVTKNITVQLDPSGNVVIQAADVDDNSTDNCGIATRELDKTEFTCANIGPNTVKLKVTDKNGNFDIKDAIVTVENKIIPKVLTKNITLQLNAAGNVSIVAADIDNRSTFVCGIPTLAVTPNTFTCANVGVNIVTLTATDVYGNVSSEKATVTIEDKIAATVLTKNATVQLDATGNAVITAAQIDNGSSDLCGIASVTVSPSTFSCNNVGANTVTLTVTDVNGNKSSATAIVTVQDNILPMAKTKDLTVALDDAGNASITVNQINNGSSDNCSVASVSLDKFSFDCTNVGVNTVLLTVKDKAGNTATATAKVTVVNKFGDNDNDGIPDNCDDDDDNDGIKDSEDNCPITFNPYQEDRNHNGIGDACDKDQVNISEAFTPNGDGINDTWVISNIEYYPASTVRVFNRWGTEVFVARNYQNDWDGHYKGNSSSLPESSSYYYQIDLDGDGAIDRQGWIYINR
jgi:gliding motility-associated-like protein